MSKLKKKFAFTLAEVLITIAVIGVVSGLTIPPVVKNYQDVTNYTKWKKQYSAAKQAIRAVQAKNGTVDITSSETLYNDIDGAIGGFINKGTWDSLNAQYYYYYKNNSAGSTLDGTAVTGTRHDGSMWGVLIPSNVNDCDGYTLSGLTGICASMYVDVNGTAPPNMYGKDLFLMWLIRINGEYNFYPYGSRGDGKTCVAGANNSAKSTGCSTTSLFSSPADMP